LHYNLILVFYINQFLHINSFAYFIISSLILNKKNFYIYIKTMKSNIRDSYNIKKIRKFNNIDQNYNEEDLKNLIIKPEKIEKPNIDISKLLDEKINQTDCDLKDSIKKRTNKTYKGIIKDKDFDFNKNIKQSEDLIIYKVNNNDKNQKVFDEKMNVFKTEIDDQNVHINNVYSLDNKNTHKKEFEYQHRYKYRSKINTDDSDLRIDRIEYYKNEQNKIDNSKKKIDNILLNLIDSGILSENLDSIDYDKVNTDDLENTLKNVFGDEEFKKIMDELE